MTDHQRNASVFVLETDEVVVPTEPEPSAEVAPATDDVQVFARFRPLQAREAAVEGDGVYQWGPQVGGVVRALTVQRPSSAEEKAFVFDGLFPGSATQAEVYQRTARPLVHELLRGINCTLMAYGQTGSGKSYTLMGPAGGPHGPVGPAEDPVQAGLVPRLVEELFAELSARSNQAVFTVQCSYVQLYMEKVCDLLNPALDNLKLREVVTRQFSPSKKLKAVKSLVYVENCTVCTCQSAQDVWQVLRRGDPHRVTAATEMNERSSRSHSVLVLNVTQTELVRQTRRSSKLFLVDLAGSEQVNRSGVTGLTLEQAKRINKSLSALSLVIQALVERKKGSHIPYRDSKLTRLLTDSLGGNAKTVLLLACSPAGDSVAETYSTLAFGARAKKMENRATVNEELTVGTYKKLVAALGQEVDVWKRRCAELEQLVPATATTPDPELLARLETLEQTKAAAEAEVVRWKELWANLPPVEALPPAAAASAGDPVDVTGEDVGGDDPTRRTREPWDELCLFQTGHLVVLGADNMFTFEAF